MQKLKILHATTNTSCSQINTFKKKRHNVRTKDTSLRNQDSDFPGDPVDMNPPANAGDMGLSLVWEDSTCLGATKSTYHNY